MTNEEIVKHYERMVEIYGDSLPHPEHEPIRFQHYVKTYFFYHVVKNETESNSV